MKSRILKFERKNKVRTEGELDNLVDGGKISEREYIEGLVNNKRMTPQEKKQGFSESDAIGAEIIKDTMSIITRNISDDRNVQVKFTEDKFKGYLVIILACDKQSNDALEIKSKSPLNFALHERGIDTYGKYFDFLESLIKSHLAGIGFKEVLDKSFRSGRA